MFEHVIAITHKVSKTLVNIYDRFIFDRRRYDKMVYTDRGIPNLELI